VARELVHDLGRLLDEVPPLARDRAIGIIAAGRSVEIERGVPYFPASFPGAALLVVAEGFVVLRASAPDVSRSVVTCEAGPGRVLPPPSAGEALFGLGATRVVVVSAEAREQLLCVPEVAQRLIEQLLVGFVEKREALANFAATHHCVRVRRKLLQLARSYGHVVREGIRIDFPISHALLAEMIGSSRETVTRALDELQREGFVARRGSTYWLLVPPESALPGV
jgi:DNA-binding MarR family transcriptional regulator